MSDPLENGHSDEAVMDALFEVLLDRGLRVEDRTDIINSTMEVLHGND